VRIVFSPCRSDLPAPVLSVANGALLNDGEPIAAPYLVEMRAGEAVVLLPIGPNATAAQRFPAPVDLVEGPVAMPAPPPAETPAETLSRAQWDWMLVRFRLHEVINAVMAALDAGSETDAEREAYADLYRMVHHARSYRLSEVQRLVAAYSAVIQATVGRAVTNEELAAAFAAAAQTPA
jgi:uncharacterized protein YfkK (UPF0435 family)